MSALINKWNFNQIVTVDSQTIHLKEGKGRVLPSTEKYWNIINEISKLKNLAYLELNLELTKK